MLKSIVPYVGSKQKCLDLILPYISVESEVYIEPFCGSCAVAIAMLQTRPNHFKHILLADKSEDLINLWRYIQSTPESFKTDLHNFLRSYSDKEITSLSSDNELEMLLRKYVMLTCSFMSAENRGLIGDKVASLRAGGLRGDVSTIEALSELLEPVTFICDSFESTLDLGLSYGLHTSCFADPPYREVGLKLTNWYTGNNFVDLVDLSRYISRCNSFILSHSKDEVLDLVFKGYRQTEVELKSFSNYRKEVYIYK